MNLNYLFKLIFKLILFKKHKKIFLLKIEILDFNSL